MRYCTGTSELYRITDYCLKNQKSLNVGAVQTIVLALDQPIILEWRDGLGRRLNPPKIDPYTIFRVDQSLLFSSKLFVLFS